MKRAGEHTGNLFFFPIYMRGKHVEMDTFFKNVKWTYHDATSLSYARNRFKCPSAGLFPSGVTGLGFGMEGEGEVLYWTVPWDRRLLAQRGKRPAGPLFKFTCLKGSVCQLQLPHCELHSSEWRFHERHSASRPLSFRMTSSFIDISSFSYYHW